MRLFLDCKKERW